MRENEKSILPNEAEAAFGVENAAEPERAERRITAENLWEIIASLQGNTFYTAKNLPFTYTVKGGELFTDRRGRSVTRSTFEKAFEKIRSDAAETGPKKLNMYGAPYVFAVLKAIGAVPPRGAAPEKE